MGTMMIIMIALTAIALVFGILYGMGRGFNRSILRLILIIGCIVGAIYLRKPIIEALVENNMTEELLASLSKGLPENFQSVVSIVINVILSIIVYFILFFILRIVSWLIIFPIFKIFVKKEDDKKVGLGALIGLIQGIVVACAVLVPLNGLVTQVNRLSKVEIVIPAQIQGVSGEEEQTGSNETKPLFVLPEGIGLEEYTKSGLATIYNKAGDWYFDMVSSIDTPDGRLSFRDVCDVVISTTDIMKVTSDVSEAVQSIRGGNKSNEELADSLKKIGENLNKTDQKLDEITAKSLIDDIFSIAAGSEEELNFSVSELKLDSLGDAFISIGDYYTDGIIEKKDAQNIVNGLVDNWGLLEKAFPNGIGKMLDLTAENQASFESALDGVEEAQKREIKEMFGLS